MINLFPLSFYIPNAYQAISLVLFIVNIFIIHQYLDKKNIINRFPKYIGILLLYLLIVSTAWETLVSLHAIDPYSIVDTFAKIPNSKMYDLLAGNSVALIFLYLRFKPSFSNNSKSSFVK